MTENKNSLRDEELSQISGGTVLPYIVLPGDSLGAVAKKFHVTEDQLCHWNNLSMGSILAVGQKLIIKF